MKGKDNGNMPKHDFFVKCNAKSKSIKKFNANLGYVKTFYEPTPV